MSCATDAGTIHRTVHPMTTLDPHELAVYRHQGHPTVNGVFGPGEMDALVRDIEAWGEESLRDLPRARRARYVDGVTARFPHGNIVHQPEPDHGARWRRARALHYVHSDVGLARPAGAAVRSALELRISRARRSPAPGDDMIPFSLTRRALVAATLAVVASGALAQWKPTHPISLIV